MKRLIISMVMMCFSLSALAGPASKQELVDSVINLSSIKISINSIPSQLSQIPAMIPVDEQDKGELMEVFMAELSAGFNEADALNSIEQYFMQHGEKAKLAAIVEWLSSPEGKAVTQIELLGLSVDPMEANNFIMGFNPASYDAARLSAIQAIVTDTNIEEMMFSMLEKLIPPMVKSMKGTDLMQDMPAEQLAQFDSIFEQQMATMRSSMAPMIAQQMVAALAFTYKDLSLADLQKYSAFVGTDAGKHYYEISMAATVDLCVEWLTDVMPKILALAEQETKVAAE